MILILPRKESSKTLNTYEFLFLQKVELLLAEITYNVYLYYHLYTNFKDMITMILVLI